MGDIFEELGIYGWEDITPTLVSALSLRLPILFIGNHGGCKTTGAQKIGAVLYRGKFGDYEVPNLKFEDLVGFTNPKAITENKLEFVPTPISIWDKEVILLDEINRANPFLQSKLHELVRRRTVMGFTTKVKQVFGAINPPALYETTYLDMALASRFVLVRVPNFKELKKSLRTAMLYAKDDVESIDLSNNLRKLVIKVAKGTVNDEKVVAFVSDLANDLNSNDVVFEGRQFKMLYNLLLRLVAYIQISGDVSQVQLVNCVRSVVPQCFDIVRGLNKYREKAEDIIAQHCTAASFHKTVNSVIGVVSSKLDDQTIVASTLQMMSSVTLGEVEESLSYIQKMGDTDLKKKLQDIFVAKILTLKASNKKSFAKLLEEFKGVANGRGWV